VSPGASEPLEDMGKLCLLVSRPVRDLVGKVAGNVVPKGQHRGALEPRCLGACLLVPGPWLASLPGHEPRPGPGCCCRSGASGFGRAPECQAEVTT
jgi:hypothetical protein